MATVTTPPSVLPRNGNYADIDGVRSYYEVNGSGEPLFLLHGGLCAAETFDQQTSELAQHYRVYVPERFGHGRTADIAGPITYESMAQHTIALIDALGVASLHIGGWSDGALVALLVALRRPRLVRKLVWIDQYVTLEDAPQDLLPFLAGFTVQTAPPFLVEMYNALSPDGPEHLGAVIDKLRTLWLSPTGVDISDLERVTAPTLILAADDGAMTIDHVAAVQRVLPNVQVAIVPGTSHGVAMEKPQLVNRLILEFLADEQMPKMF